MLPVNTVDQTTERFYFPKIPTFKRKKLLRWLLYSVITIIAGIGIVGFTLYNKPQRDVSKAIAISINAVDLATKYDSNEITANSQFLDKVIEVKGEIGEISSNQKGETIVSLKGTDFNSVRCTLQHLPLPKPVAGKKVSIKGICTGYLTDVIMVRCILSKKLIDELIS